MVSLTGVILTKQRTQRQKREWGLPEAQGEGSQKAELAALTQVRPIRPGDASDATVKATSKGSWEEEAREGPSLCLELLSAPPPRAGEPPGELAQPPPAPGHGAAARRGVRTEGLPPNSLSRLRCSASPSCVGGEACCLQPSAKGHGRACFRGGSSPRPRSRRRETAC